MAVVGRGQQGTENIESMIRTEKLVAVFDVDMANVAEANSYPKRDDRDGWSV